MTPLDLPVSHPPLYHSHLIRNKSTVQRGAWPVQGSLRNQTLEWPSVDGSFRTGHPKGGRIKSKTAPSIRLRNEESSLEADRQRARSRAVPRDIGLAFCPRRPSSGPPSPILLHQRLGLRRIPFRWRSNPHSGGLPINRADGSPRFDVRRLPGIDVLR